eukprot:PhF_6_TR38559/c0_g1_i1/m.57242
MRRFQPSSSYLTSSSLTRKAATTPSLHLTSMAAYSGIGSILWTCAGGAIVTMVGAQWAHSMYNVYLHGAFRFRMEMDADGPSKCYPLQFVGGFIAFVLWFFVFGPKRFKRTDLEKWQPRLGPF